MSISEIIEGKSNAAAKVAMACLAAAALPLVDGWRAGILFGMFAVAGCGLVMQAGMGLSRLASLRDAVGRLEEDGRAKETFFAMMSHEMRTPLNGVIGLADVLAESDLCERDRRHVRTLLDSANDLLQIINDLLDFSKMRAENGLAVESVGFDLERVVGGAVATLTQIAQRKGIEIVSDVDSDVPRRLVGDGPRLKQVLINLIGNAVKFTDAGHVRIAVSRAGEAAGRVSLRFAVEDTGSGIPKKALSKLFEAFSQVDASVWRRHGGTGLGLVISRKIVEAMGSRIEVESEEGRGSRFSFTIAFPVFAGSVADDELKGVVRKVEGKRILLAEDNQTNVLVATTLLRKMGHEVDVAVNGIEAVNLAAKGGYDLILMDLMMPVMGGLEAAARIRSLEGASARVPILALTANSSRERIDDVVAAGMNAMVSKPITRVRLESAVAEAVAGSERRAADAGGVGSRRAAAIPLFDRGIMEELAGEVGSDGVVQMVEVFMTDTAEAIDRLRAVEIDVETLERTAHSLRSSAGIFGFVRLSELAADVERNARRHEDPRGLVRNLETAFEETQRSLKAA